MVLPTIWGPPIWIFFHTIIVKIKDENFDKVGLILFNYIKQICNYLPCPECSLHSKVFFSKVDNKSIDTKIKLLNLFYIFHNNVNKRKNKLQLKYEDIINLYDNNNLLVTYNNFVRVYNIKGNLNQINESFHRQRLILEFKKWLMLNIRYFNIK
jgi:hypothetical protein